MKYKLISKKLNPEMDLGKQILSNRGIVNPEKYMSLDNSCLNSYNDLDNINKAIKCFQKHFKNRDKIAILQDVDFDGYASSALMYMYIKELDRDYPLYTIQHTFPKVHGLNQMNKGDFQLQEGTKLFIVPDAGSEDFEIHKQLKSEGVDVIILDHHECDKGYSPHAIVVNNQLSSKFDNKNLCGTGVVMKFLQALDEEEWNFYADGYKDLNAFANIADVMDMREYETKFLADEGLTAIKNPFIKQLIKEQEYSLKGSKLNKIKVAFYIVPLLNAMIRFGTFEEKELVFQALTCQREDEDFIFVPKTGPRKGVEVHETIYERAARLCKNVKATQDSSRDKAIKEFEEIIEQNPNKDTDKILIVPYNSNIDSTLSGLSAMILASKYKRPVLVGKVDSFGKVSGSARNYGRFIEQDLRSTLTDSGYFEYCRGHEGAFGFSLERKNIDKVIKWFNEKYQNAEIENFFGVDDIYPVSDIPDNLFDVVDSLSGIWGTNVDEPLFAFEDIDVETKDIFIMGSKTKMSNYKFYSNGIQFIKFSAKTDDKLLRYCEDWTVSSVKLQVVGRVGYDSYSDQNIKTVYIEDYNIVFAD